MPNMNFIAIPPNALGKALLIGIRPRYQYVDGVRTDEINAYRYDLILIERGYTQVSVNIPGTLQLAMPNDGSTPAVELLGMLEIYAYANSGRGLLGMRAEGIQLAGK